MENMLIWFSNLHISSHWNVGKMNVVRMFERKKTILKTEHTLYNTISMWI